MDVVDHLQVLGVAVEGTDVLVDLVGGEAPICGSVRFTFADAIERRRHVRVLEGWSRTGTQVTLVSRDGVITLTNPCAVLRRALSSDA